MCSTVSTRVEDGVAVIRLVGEVDAALRDQASAALRCALASGEPLLLDLAGVRFLDSSGVSFLVECHLACAERHRDYALRDVPEIVARVLSILGLTAVLHLPGPC